MHLLSQADTNVFCGCECLLPPISSSSSSHRQLDVSSNKGDSLSHLELAKKIQLKLGQYQLWLLESAFAAGTEADEDEVVVKAE